MLVSISSVAIGVVLGWQAMVGTRAISWVSALKLLLPSLALFLLTYFGPGKTSLALFGLAGGMAGHLIMIAHLKQRRAAR